VNGLKHPFSGALYEQDGQGNILVTQGDKSGLFKGDGRWISGELRQADPQLCNGWRDQCLATTGSRPEPAPPRADALFELAPTVLDTHRRFQTHENPQNYVNLGFVGEITIDVLVEVTYARFLVFAQGDTFMRGGP
jgi:hypothetical protein